MGARVPMPAGFKTLVDSWMLRMRAEAKSPATLTKYGVSVRLFAAWVVELPADGFPPPAADLTEVSRDHCRAWLAHLVDAGLPRTTVGRGTAGSTSSSPGSSPKERSSATRATGFRCRHPGQTQVPTLTVEQMRTLVKQFGRSEYRDVRDEAIVRLVLDSGLRLSELANLTLDDVDLLEGTGR